MGRKSWFSEEFKAEAWRMVESGRSVDDVASDSNVGLATLWRLARRFRCLRAVPNAVEDDAAHQFGARLIATCSAKSVGLP